MSYYKFIGAVSNIVIAAVGIGMLALPGAVAQAGWGGFAILLPLSAIIVFITTNMIYKCMSDQYENNKSYDDIGATCIPSFGRIMVLVPILLDILCVCTLLLILAGSGLKQLFNISEFAGTTIFTIIILPFTWISSLNEIGIISFIGLIALFILTITIIIISINKDYTNPGITTKWPNDVKTLGLSFADFMKSYAIAPVMPTLFVGIRKTENIKTILFTGLLIVTILFGIVGACGYLGWGSSIMNYENLIDALTHDNGNSYYSLILRYGILAVCFCHFLVMFNPACIITETIIKKLFKNNKNKLFDLKTRNFNTFQDVLLYDDDSDNDATKIINNEDFNQSSLFNKNNYCYTYTIIIRTILISLCYIMAITIPKFYLIIDGFGSTLVMLLQIVFPIMFYITLIKPNMCKRIISGCIFIMGLFGLIFSIWAFIKEVSNKN
jgi:amino acid permease